MNCTSISSYLDNHFKDICIRKTIKNALFFFLKCALRAKTLVPTKVGQKTTTAKARNGVKRVQRLLTNTFFTIELIEDIYCSLIAKLIPENSDVLLAVDWTIIKEKFCFLSVSWIINSGRSIPLYFAGYKKEELGICNSQNSIEQRSIAKVIAALSHVTNITITADRGFDSPDMLTFLMNNRVTFIIRSKTERYITLQNGSKLRLTHNFIKRGTQKKYRNIEYTRSNPVRVNLYAKWQPDQKESWILLSNRDMSIEKITSIYARRWEIEEMFKSLKNQDVGFNIKTVKLRDLDRWLRFLFLATILFQFLGMLGRSVRKIAKIEQRYSLSSKTPKNQKWIYSIYSIAMLVLEDMRMRLRYEKGGFQFNVDGGAWVSLC